MTLAPTQLYEEFMQIAETGDESAAEKFLSEHLADFPEETRNEIISAYVKDAIAQEAGEVSARLYAEKGVIDALDDVKSAHNEIDNQQKIQELKQKLGTE